MTITTATTHPTTAETIGTRQPLLSTIIFDHVTRLDRHALEREVRAAYPSLGDDEVMAVILAANEACADLVPTAIGVVTRIVRARGLT